MHRPRFSLSWNHYGRASIQTRNSYTNESTISGSEQSLTRNSLSLSRSIRNSQENENPQSISNYSSRAIENKLFVDETWLSNKHYNQRVASSVDSSEIQRSNRYKLNKFSRTATYQAPDGKIVHERVYPPMKREKVHLDVAVNGASKSMRGQLPLSNLNLTNGDFGDDAGMIMETQDYVFVGLADGAGGNRSLGINPADFSRAILASCREILHQTNLTPNQLPRLILEAMHRVEANRIRGSSTLCFFALDKIKNSITSLNIGDSGFIIYRNNEIYRRSKCTMNGDGCGPKQLFAVNGSFGLPCFINENDLLRNCSVDTFPVEKDDTIILSSDGLWDVIKADQLHEIMERNVNRDLQDLADDLLNHAVGGYIVNERDDILVIVCRVV